MNIRIEYIKIAMVTMLVVGLLPLAISTASACDYNGCETRTPGFWKTHPNDWPVNKITIGGVTYTKDEAIQIMQTSGKGDKTYTMFNALVTAKLNLINRCDDCIKSVVDRADIWMSNNHVGSNVRGSSDAWQKGGELLYLKLDAYNNGEGCH